MKTIAYAARDAQSPLSPFTFERRAVGARDVRIDILYCGICHSDLHQARNEWNSSIYPMVPGHEIVGRVAEIGKDVKKYQVGDTVGVGCMVDSCRVCASCRAGLEQFCEEGMTPTYNGMLRDGKTMSQGGYSKTIVVDEDFVLRIPAQFSEGGKLSLASAAPLLCAGITTYSPLRYWKVGKGSEVGVVGLGGLGHMAVQIAKAMGARVTVFSTSPKKRADALRLGADAVILSNDPAEMAKHARQFDFILDTVSATHDLDAYLDLLRHDGTLLLVGAPEENHPAPLFHSLVMRRLKIAGSLIGGIPETQEMLDFCGAHGIGSHVEVIDIKDVNAAYERLLKGDVKYRFVIDLATLKE